MAAAQLFEDRLQLVCERGLLKIVGQMVEPRSIAILEVEQGAYRILPALRLREERVDGDHRRRGEKDRFAHRMGRRGRCFHVGRGSGRAGSSVGRGRLRHRVGRLIGWSSAFDLRR